MLVRVEKQESFATKQIATDAAVASGGKSMFCRDAGGETRRLCVTAKYVACTANIARIKRMFL